jgi:DNA repair photolyase
MKIYEPAGRAREYSPLALNYFKGCEHNCLYCYVPNMLTRFNSQYQHSNVVTQPNYKEIELSAKKFQGCGKQILFSFTTDPYTKQNINQTKTVLEILNRYGHKVAILTKGGKRVLRDIDTFKSFGDRIKIGVSLTFDNDKDSKEWESGASLPSDRVNSVFTLASEGIKTWASFEPVIFPDQSLNLLKQVVQFIDHVKIGKINNYKGIDKKIDWAKFIFDSVRILREYKINDRFYIKKDLLMHNVGVYLSGNETNEDYLNL